MAWKPVKIQKESPAGCAGEGKQSKGNQEKRKGQFKNGKKPVKLQKESPAGCAGEGKQSKGNQEKNTLTSHTLPFTSHYRLVKLSSSQNAVVG